MTRERLRNPDSAYRLGKFQLSRNECLTSAPRPSSRNDLAIVENQAGPIADTGLEQVGAGQFQYRPTGSPWTFAGSAGIAANNSAFTAGNPAAPDRVPRPVQPDRHR